jgi:hypothetical protein
VVSAKGRRLFNAARRRRIEAVANLLEPLSGKDLERLEDAAAILNGILEHRSTGE